jgi:predicted dehydrogenase
MTKTRIAVAGAGVIGRAHVEAARRSATCTLSAIVDPSPHADALAREHGVPLCLSLEELFARHRPDGVVLATPNTLHAAQAILAISTGVPALVEKPIATTVTEAEAIVSAAESARARILVGHHRAHSPIMARAREIVQQGSLGRIVAIQGSALFYKPDAYFADSPWRREMGGGPILINMIHEVHNLRILCGEVKAVQAFASNAVRGFAVEDTVTINLLFASGALGSFLLSDTAACARSWEQTSGENTAYPAYADEDCYVIAGTDGSLSVPTMRLKRYGRSEDRSWWTPFEVDVVNMIRDDPIKLQMEHFGAVVRGEAQPLVPASDGLRNLRVTDAIAEAARTGKVIAIPAD